MKSNSTLLKMFMVAVFFATTQVAKAAPAGADGDDRGESVLSPIPKSSADDADVYLNVGTGLSILNGTTGWGLSLGGLTRVAEGSSWYVGADAGLNFWNFNSAAGVASSSATGLQLLPTAIYRFSLAGMRTVYPYLGASVGPTFYFERSTLAGGTLRNATQVYLQVMARPGVYTTLTEAVALNVEAKFGLLNNNSIFMPQVNAIFNL